MLRIGCRVCERIGDISLWARFQVCSAKSIRRCAVLTHVNSIKHQRAADGADIVDAPTKDEFKSVLDITATTNDMVTAKLSARTWCLAEAKLDMERSAARAAVSVCLGQDARRDRLLVAASISTSNLECKRFTLGSVPMKGTDAVAIRSATERVIDRFCTPRMEPPPYGKLKAVAGTEAVLDADLKTRLTSCVDAIVTDNASDECRACRLLSGSSVSTFVGPLLDNMAVHAKDPTHASLRLIKCFAVEPSLGDTFAPLISDYRSAANLIQHSPEVASKFQGHIEKLEGAPVTGAKIRNMKYIKPRFNSTQAPLSRSMLFFDAVVAVCVEVAATREGKPAQSAQWWLCEVN